MKTVAKTGFALFAALAGLALCAPTNVFAQVSGSSVSAVAGSAQQIPDIAPKSDKAEAPPLPSAISIPTPPTAPSLVSPLAAKTDPRAGKVPDSVKDVVKRLGSASDNVTLEDLNSAREAVAKLDLLIDIEKRLNDLTTLRQEREEKSGASLAGAIPASALGAKNISLGGMPNSFSMQQPITAPNQGPPVTTMPTPAPSFSGSGDSVELQKVMGAGGSYVAFVKTSDGKSKQYRVNEKLADGSIIKSISSHGMTVEKDKKTRTIKVKDISVVFSGR